MNLSGALMPIQLGHDGRVLNSGWPHICIKGPLTDNVVEACG